MDKYEYQVCTEQIKQLITEKRFVEAMEIADTIDWRRVRSVSMLVTVSEIYKVNKRYEDAKDILLLAYERHPNGRDIVYALCELFIKLGDVVQAIESYKEFMAIAPDDATSCILLYKIYKAQDVSLEEQIDVLEEYKKRDYREKWAYELAYLYHKTGQEAKCVAECDELILWFGEGKYVRKAMELKMQHTSLSKDQQAKFDGRAITGNMPVFEQPMQSAAQFGNNAQQTGPMIDMYGEYIQQTGQFGTTGQIEQYPYDQNTGYTQNTYVQDQYTQAMPNMYQDPSVPVNITPNMYQDPSMPVNITPGMYQDSSAPINVTPGMNHLGMTQDIMTQALGTGVWNTVDMQNQIGSGVREVMQNDESFMNQGSDVQVMEEPIMEEPVREEPVKEEPVNEGYIKEESVKEDTSISVNTGIIDISESDLLINSLPGSPLPDDDDKKSEDETESDTAGSDKPDETGDIMSKLEGVIPKSKTEITGRIPSILPSADEVNKDTESKPMEKVVETKDEELSRISAVQEKAFPGYVAPEIGIFTTDSVTGKAGIKEEKLTLASGDGKYPYDTVTDIGYVEELPEIEQPEDVDDILKTGKLPTEDISKASAYETDDAPEMEEYEIDEVDDDEDDKMPAFMRGNVRAKREFNDNEYKIFCRYDGMENVKAQLVDALDKMSMDPASGNVIIMGPESADTKGIAISIVKAMQGKNPEFSGKVAKISGEALNKKNIKLTLEKLENGALIVERAGGLTQESVVLINATLSESKKPILVLFEGIRENIKPLFRYTKLMKTVFDARIDIAEYTNDDLVNYGRGYALEKEYAIDEMGGLALHNRISEMQTFDHKVTIEEVKEIIDMAIKHVDKKNMGHFLDMLLGRRYDDEDNIILGEKDFIF